MLLLPDLIEYTSQTQTFPVQVENIKQWFVDRGIQEEINLLEVEMRRDVCAAIFERRSGVAPPYADTPRVANILISNELNECWKRLIACKEMIHLTDSEGQRAKTREQIQTLIEDIRPVFNGYNQDVSFDDRSPAVKADFLAFKRAFFLLAPLSAVDGIRDAYTSGAVDDSDVALFLKIPEVFIPMIMSEVYSDAYTSAKFELVSDPLETRSA